jgi:hypothetical protein
VKVTCALVQMNFWTDVEENVARACDDVRDAWGFFRDRRPEVYREVVAP